MVAPISSLDREAGSWAISIKPCPLCGSSTPSPWAGPTLERIVAAREPQNLPVVLSADEIVRFLEAVPGLRNRAALTTAYGAGLRVGEVARLTIGAVDSGRMLIRVEHGKGGKDRYVMLSPQLLADFARVPALGAAEPLAVPRVYGVAVGVIERILREG